MRTRIFVLSLLLLGLGGAGAHAHAMLSNSSPPVGGSVGSAPRQVSLSFTQSLEPSFSSVAPLHCAGRRLLRVESNQGKAQAALCHRHEGSPFGIGGLWENWKDPTSGGWIRTFAIMTTAANEPVAEIHDRMPLIIAHADYERWLSDEPDAHDLMRPYPAEPMRMWPISTRVNKPENDHSSILEPIKMSPA